MLDHSIRLASDEYVVLSADGAHVKYEPEFMRNYKNELTLTNKRIIWSKEQIKVFGKGDVSSVDLPLSSIKVVDGLVQAREEKVDSIKYLVLYLKDGSTVTYDFYPNYKLIKDWVREITRLLGGDIQVPNESRGSLIETTNAVSAIPYAEDVAKAVVGTVDVFKSAFRRSKIETAPVVAVHCPRCGAAAKVRKGQTMYCQYCGSPLNAPE